MGLQEFMSEVSGFQPLWSSAAAAAKWVIETLLKRHSEAEKAGKEKWTQVADYLDKVATLVDGAVAKYQKKKIPYDEYYQLTNLDDEFEDVLKQVFTDKKKIERCVEAYREALYLCEGLDHDPMQFAAELLFTKPSIRRQAIEDLRAVAASFRAVAMTLRATS